MKIETRLCGCSATHIGARYHVHLCRRHLARYSAMPWLARRVRGEILDCHATRDGGLTLEIRADSLKETL